MSGLFRKPAESKAPTEPPKEVERRTPGDDVVVPRPAPPEEPKEEPKKRVIPLWFVNAKKLEGKHETDSAFNRYMSGFWRIVGLPNYKTIVGTSFAWCGLFIAAMLYGSDLPWQKNGAGASNWDNYGVSINWKQDGIPQGAIVRINHDLDCSSQEGNHVAFADGDCTPEDLKKPNATINLYGGNQGNKAKVSTYSVKKICSVRWPNEVAKPGRITKSIGCAGKSTSKESTR